MTQVGSKIGSDHGGGSQQNVVLVTVDSLRADHCGYWGYDRDTTPTLDRMAERGFVFERAIAPGPSTYESMPAVFTGRHMTTFRKGIGSVESGEVDAHDDRVRDIRMNMTGPTIPEWFAERGYTTGAFTTNPYTGRHTEFKRGFAQYEDFLVDDEGPLMQRIAEIPGIAELNNAIRMVRGSRASNPWRDYYEDVIRWARNTPEPYFLWVFVLDTHTPYLPESDHRFGTRDMEMYYHNWRLWMEKKWRKAEKTENLNREKLVDLYDATIRSVDEFLSRLLNDLSDGNPVILVHSDHGEAFGEHGIYGHQKHLYEENVHVPLVLYNAGIEGSEPSPVSLIEIPDILATSAENPSLPSISVGEPVLCKTRDARNFALYGERWKYICRTEYDQPAILDGELYWEDIGHSRIRDEVDQSGFKDSCDELIRRRLYHEAEVNALVSGIATGMTDSV